MSKKIGRNAPCPCGSGKKFKKCCSRKGADRADSFEMPPIEGPGGGFRFEPGAYGTPDRGYLPSILCRKQVAGAWQPHFLLAHPVMPFDDWTRAAELVTVHLDSAYEEKMAAESDEAAAHKLSALGYKSISGYRLEEFRPIEVAPGLGGHLGAHKDSLPDLDDPMPARTALLNVVDEQIQTENPKETGLTFQRLLDLGHDADAAKELIAMLVAAELYELSTQEREFDLALYEKNLRRLPELPENLRE